MHSIRMTTYSIIAIIPLVLLAGGGCGSRQEAETTPAAEPPPPEPTAPAQEEYEEPWQEDEDTDVGAEEEAGLEEDVEVDFTPVYFDYDSAVLRPDQRDTLSALGVYLQENPEVTLLIEGHADERGTDEYNIALGERRAQAVHDYLVRLGVPAERIATISYGEERPAAAGYGEEAWALNRRAELVPRR